MMGPEPTDLRTLGVRIRHKPAGRWEGPKEGTDIGTLLMPGGLVGQVPHGNGDDLGSTPALQLPPWDSGNTNTTKTSAQNAPRSGCSESWVLRVLVSWVLSPLQGPGGQVYTLFSRL